MLDASSVSLVRAQTTTDGLAEFCGADPGVICRIIYEQTGHGTVAAVIDAFASRGGRIVVILLVAWFVRRVIRRQLPRFTAAWIERRDIETRVVEEIESFDINDSKRIDRELRRDRARQRANTLGDVVASVLNGVVIFVTLLMVIDQFGVNLAPLIAGAGVVGIALGFGAQQVVKDFLAGMFIIFEDEFGVGDVVDTGLASGVVERLTLRVTQLRDVNGTVWYVPNGEIQRVGNRSQLWSRAVIDIDVSYDTDVDEAAAILLDVANGVWQEQLPERTIIGAPEYWGVEAFGADGVTLRLVVKTEPTEQWATARELRGRIKRAFDDAGIEIPFPQRTLWIQQSPGETTPTAPLGPTRAPDASDGGAETGPDSV